jgi:hypothetical protein
VSRASADCSTSQVSVFACLAILPAGYFVYTASRPGPNGEPPALTKFLSNFDYFQQNQARNDARTRAIEQAAEDKHLFLNAGRNMHVDLKTPEYVLPQCLRLWSLRLETLPVGRRRTFGLLTASQTHRRQLAVRHPSRAHARYVLRDRALPKATSGGRGQEGQETPGQERSGGEGAIMSD